MLPITAVKQRRAAGTTITNSVSLPTGIIFETNFANDTGYDVLGGVGFGSTDVGKEPPSGWDAIRADSDNRFKVTTEGVSGSNAMRLEYDQGGDTRASMTLAKHLTQNIGTGFTELYIRYRVKLPSNIRIGTGSGGPFWKWGRLWQNVSPDATDSTTWTENRRDSGYMMWGFYSAVAGAKAVYTLWSDTESSTGTHTIGSNGGPQQEHTWRESGDVTKLPGHFKAIGGDFDTVPGEWDTDGNGALLNTTQTYHTMELHMKMATSAVASDGVLEMWIDGINQGSAPFTRSLFSAEHGPGISTTVYPGGNGGWNHFSCFDNMQDWAQLWQDPGVDGYILINDVVVSTDRIGDTYVAGNTDNTGA